MHFMDGMEGEYIGGRYMWTGGERNYTSIAKKFFRCDYAVWWRSRSSLPFQDWAVCVCVFVKPFSDRRCAFLERIFFTATLFIRFCLFLFLLSSSLISLTLVLATANCLIEFFSAFFLFGFADAAPHSILFC